MTGVRPAGSPGAGCLHERFREHARSGPDRAALSSGDVVVTYGELDERSDAVAARLGALGVGPDVLVALCARRGVDAIVGLLGILKAGGAYVPVDPAYPAERVDYLLSDCAAPVVVATADTAALVRGRGASVVLVDDPAPPPAEPPTPAVEDHHLAYVIYTSGSTGAPKGVAVEHRNVVRLFASTRQWFAFDDRDVWSLFHSLSFDFSVWEVWGALLHGGRLALLPELTTRSPALLVARLRAERVTVLSQTPSSFHQLQTTLLRGDGADPTAGTDLRVVVFGGERLDPLMLAPWIGRHGDDRPVLVNMYGITETTVHVTYRRITTADLACDGPSPIGVPIPDLRVQVLDERGQPVPAGTPGELYVAGAGLARGYLHRPELTSQRFATGPDGTRHYRTGDRGVRLPDGDLAYLGRVDDQVQVRGFRIEPAEVELCLARVPGVAAAAVAPRTFADGDVRLVAYLLPAAGARAADLETAAERRAMASLPRHLRPSLYTVVSEIPMTANGKVDRHALGR